MSDSHERWDLDLTQELSRLKRRDFLRVGAAATAGATLLPSWTHARSAPPPGDPDTPCTDGPCGAGNDCRGGHCATDGPLDDLADDPNFDDPPDCPDHVDAPLARVDETTEVVLGYLWSVFAREARKANGKVKDIHCRALECGIHRIRGAVWTESDKVKGVLSEFDLDGFQSRWETMGTLAGSQTGSPQISLGVFKKAFDGVYGAGKEWPRDIPSAGDRGTELVGGHLWFRFTIGLVSFNEAKEIPLAVFPVGRSYSREHVRDNVVRDVVEKGPPGNKHLNWTRWCFNEVGDCAYIAGRRAARNAKTNPAISATDFGKAWCSVSAGMHAYYAKCGAERGMMSAACG